MPPISSCQSLLPRHKCFSLQLLRRSYIAPSTNPIHHRRINVLLGYSNKSRQLKTRATSVSSSFSLSPLHVHRSLFTTPAMASLPITSTQAFRTISKEKTTKDTWSPTKYLSFAGPRLRPAQDLLARIYPHIRVPPSSLRIFDLGCGPGTSTAVLVDAFSGAKVTGVDSSGNMLQEARKKLPGVEFVEADLNTWTVPAEASDKEGEKQTQTLVFSNATIHWLRSPSRRDLLTRLLSSPSLPEGSVLAIQVPDNYNAPTHRLMRETATLPSQPWSPYFSASEIGNLGVDDRPDLDPIEPPAQWIRWLEGAGARKGEVDVWRTEYMHVVNGAKAIVEWVGSTGLRPYLDRITDEEARRAFLAEYERIVGEIYASEGSEWGIEEGRCVLGYPRLFVVGVKG